MSRTPAKFTQADISRVIRAAKKLGAPSVELRSDGTIIVALHQPNLSVKAKEALDQRAKVEL